MIVMLLPRMAELHLSVLPGFLLKLLYLSASEFKHNYREMGKDAWLFPGAGTRGRCYSSRLVRIEIATQTSRCELLPAQPLQKSRVPQALSLAMKPGLAP